MMCIKKMDLKYFDYGRIDFVIETERFCAAVEMKIDASDGDRQLERYEEYCKSRNKNYLVFYLTPEGKSPSEHSMGHMDPDKLRLISFEETISTWLQECLDNVEPLGYKHSFLKQYLGAVKHMTKGDDRMDMKEYITDTDSAIATMALFDGFMQKMEDILICFMTRLKDIIVRDTGLSTCLDNDSLEQFYTSSGNTWPGSYTEIASVRKGRNEYCFVLKLEVEHSLYACLGFVKKTGQDAYEWLELADMKKKVPEFYSKWMSQVENLHLLNTKKSPRSVWFYLQNSGGEVINFKDFSISAIKLIDESEIQAEYIGDMLVHQVLNRLTE